MHESLTTMEGHEDDAAVVVLAGSLKDVSVDLDEI
jgi:hypothetical protein